MAIWTLGINHTTAPLDLRGRFAFAVDQLPQALLGLRQALQSANASGKTEIALLSTCNRTEIYGAGSAAVPREVVQWLATSGGVSQDQLSHHTYMLAHEQAARHAFRVAAGLDSMVLGETQVLGQLKDAVSAAQDAGALGATLQQLFQRSFSIAKEVRSSTEIGAQSISMAAAAVRLASQLFEDLAKIRILFVGAGEMIELAATHFAAKNPAQMVIANRTLERGQALAAQYKNAQTMLLSELPARLHEFDVVVSCTASTLPIIGLGAVERAVKLRKHKPILMVDLAVPRDIEPEVKALDDVYLYTVDDLGKIVQSGKDSRRAAVLQAEGIVENGVKDFLAWLTQRSEGSVDLIARLNAQSDAWRAQEIERAQRLIAKGEDVNAVLEALSRGIAAKFLHPAYQALKNNDAQQRETASKALENLYFKSENGL